MSEHVTPRRFVLRHLPIAAIDPVETAALINQAFARHETMEGDRTDPVSLLEEAGPAAEFTYLYRTLFFATDPFALDMVCHKIITAKRKEMGIAVNEHPRFTEYLRYAARLGIGVADEGGMTHIRI